MKNIFKCSHDFLDGVCNNMNILFEASNFVALWRDEKYADGYHVPKFVSGSYTMKD